MGFDSIISPAVPLLQYTYIELLICLWNFRLFDYHISN